MRVKLFCNLTLFRSAFQLFRILFLFHSFQKEEILSRNCDKEIWYEVDDDIGRAFGQQQDKKSNARGINWM